MTASGNKHGLARPLPAEVARAVRRACGFGCVFCGVALCHYDHVEPAYADAKEHDAERIALLCGGHHDARTRGRIGTADVWAARRNPRCLQQGYSRELLNCGANGEIAINVGPLATVHCRCVLRVFGRDVLWVELPEEEGAPARLNASFPNGESSLLCEIVGNEVRVLPTTWDMEIVGPVLTLRNGARDIAMRLTTVPGQSLRLERLHIRFGELRVDVDESGIGVGRTRRPKRTLGGGLVFGVPDVVVDVVSPKTMLCCGQPVAIV